VDEGLAEAARAGVGDVEAAGVEVVGHGAEYRAEASGARRCA
jgi:hypothetical protein